jgi:GxxExxY protein
MTDDDPEFFALTEQIIGCGIEVHRTLGPGLIESIYRDCMRIEMTKSGLHVVSEHRIPLF